MLRGGLDRRIVIGKHVTLLIAANKAHHVVPELRVLPLLHGQQQAKAFSSRRSKDDSSIGWSSLVHDAASLAKDVLSKVKEAALNAVTGDRHREPHQQRGPVRDALPPMPGGLLGHLLGGLLRAAASGISRQVAQMAQESQAAQSSAAARINSSSRLRARLGPVQVLPPISQSVSSQSLNGITSRRVVMLLPVLGTGGRMVQAEVTMTTSSGVSRSSILVRMPEGDILRLDGGDDDVPEGNVVDAEYRDLK